jgi:hypothetical protein
VAPPAPAPTAPPPPPTHERQPTPSSLSWSLGAGYGVSSRGDEGLWHGPRASASLAARSAFAGLLTFEAALPNTHRVGSLDLRFWSLSALLAVAIEQRPSMALRVSEFLGPSLEWTHYTPANSHEVGVKAGRAAGEFRPRITLGVSCVVGRAPNVALVLAASWLLRHTDYELEAGPSRERIGVTPTWVPSAALEVGFF